MNGPSEGMEDTRYMRNLIDLLVRLGVLLLFLTWCFLILKPFLGPIMWGVIIAVAIHPVYRAMLSRLGGKKKLAATLIVLLSLLVVIVPTWLLGDSLYAGAQGLHDRLGSDELKVPPPPQSLEDWPVIGPSLKQKWSMASSNLDAFLSDYRPQLKKFAESLLGLAAGTGLALGLFVFAIIIAGIILANSEMCVGAMKKLATRIAGERGLEFAQIANATIRSVTKGILGVAFIQAVLAGVGFVLVGVPAAGLWALIALVLAVVQLGVGLVVFPVAVYVFATSSTPVAVGFLIFAFFVTALDNVLKPILFGRGAPVPMLIIFIGAIGGLLLSGIIGLFVGAVVFSLGYKLYGYWLELGSAGEASTGAASNA